MLAVTRLSIVLPAVSLLAATTACNVDSGSSTRSPKGPIVSVAERTPSMESTERDDSFSRQSEVDLVEAMVAHRTAYLNSLQGLRDFYRDRGYASKQSWADFELEGLKRVKTFRYIMDAEVPPEALRATEANAEADAMYDKALDLMKKGGAGIPGFYRQGPMVEAVKVFRQMIEMHPSSDKIDDAAFQLGQIHREYLPDMEAIAVQWYERAWTWDPNTPYDPRFQAAVISDYRLHDRDRALELYRRVLQEETPEQPCSSKLARRTNVDFSIRRIDELTKENRTARAGG